MACPICDKESNAQYRPFCSRRCADVDLGKWLSESYRAPASDIVDPAEVADDMADGEAAGHPRGASSHPLLH